MVHTHIQHAALPSTSGFAHPDTNVGHIGITPGMTIADFGAGSGAYVFAIAELLKGNGTIYAIDAQRDLLRRIHNEAARRSFDTVSIIWSDLEKREGSKLSAGSCDVVLISNLLFQVEERDAVVREARRILRPAGHLAAIDWADSFNNMGPHKDHVITREEAERLLASNGFTIDSNFPAGAHHWGILASVTTSSPHV